MVGATSKYMVEGLGEKGEISGPQGIHSPITMLVPPQQAPGSCLSKFLRLQDTALNCLSPSPRLKIAVRPLFLFFVKIVTFGLTQCSIQQICGDNTKMECIVQNDGSQATKRIIV